MKNISLVPIFGIIMLIIPILGTSLAIFGCRTVKHKSEQIDYSKEQEFSNGRMQQQERFHYIDSSGRYWLFHTDTTFYFHPDSGLWAGRGPCLFGNSNVKWNTDYHPGIVATANRR